MNHRNLAHALSFLFDHYLLGGTIIKIRRSLTTNMRLKEANKHEPPIVEANHLE